EWGDVGEWGGAGAGESGGAGEWDGALPGRVGGAAAAPGGPADSRTMSSTGSTSVLAAPAVPAIRSNSSVTPVWARRSTGDLIVVSRGRTYWLNLMSSKPTTDRSSGTRMPCVSAADSMPSAM